MKHYSTENHFQQKSSELLTQTADGFKERVSKKEIDIFCRELLAEKSELREEILRQMENLSKHNLPMPIVHITSKTIKKSGETINTGFFENIEKKGFKKRDTNVGAFVERGIKTSIAKSDFFIEKPEEFIKSLRLFMQRYLHHGIRTNKQILGEFRDSGNAIPIMIIIEGDVKLERGSDYDDHYILKEDAAPEKIIGIVDLNEHKNPRSKDDISYLVEKLLESLAAYYNKQSR